MDYVVHPSSHVGKGFLDSTFKIKFGAIEGRSHSSKLLLRSSSFDMYGIQALTGEGAICVEGAFFLERAFACLLLPHMIVPLDERQFHGYASYASFERNPQMTQTRNFKARVHTKQDGDIFSNVARVLDA